MSGKAFVFLEASSGSLTTVERDLRIANRLRTRDREIRILDLFADDGSVPSRITVVDSAGKPIAQRCFPALSPMAPILLPSDFSFYLVSEILAGERYCQGRAVAEVHPFLLDLGTWFGGDRWRPSGGPRVYAANMEFAIGSPRRGSSRADQILALAAQGLTDKAISESLGIGTSTVETHWRLLRQRGGYASRTEAVASHLRSRSDREREDVEAQRDRLATEAWLGQKGGSSERTIGKMRSWPRV